MIIYRVTLFGQGFKRINGTSTKTYSFML